MIVISLQKYVTDLTKDRTGKLACKPASILIDPNHRLGEHREDEYIDKEIYQNLVGKLIYIYEA